MLRDARTRLICASVTLSVGVAALVLTFVYVAVTSIIEAETRSVVEAELAGLQDDYQRLGVLGLAAAIERRSKSSDRRDAIYLLADSRGRAIAGNLGAWPPNVKPGGGWVELDLIRTDSEKTVPVAAASLRLRDDERLLVGRDASALRRFDRVLFQSAGWALIGAVGLSVLTGWLLTRLIFSRIAEISRTADTIVSGDLGRRIPLRGTGDELDQLSLTLNEMLDRISELVDNLRMTTSSLSHDLRSPLTRLRTQLETLENHAGDADERARLTARAVGEVDRLLKIFNNLTEIARAEARISRRDFTKVDLGALVADGVELYAPVAEDKGLTLTAGGQADAVPGHRQLLMQMLSNLLENALRFAPKSSQVDVTLTQNGPFVELSVADQGPGLPDDFVQTATKPFTTVDQSRADGGSGLGLALVAAVARLHDGEVHLSNTHPGLRVTVCLRRADPPDPRVP